MVARSARGLARAERERPPAAAAGHAEAARAAATRYWGEGNRKNILENVNVTRTSWKRPGPLSSWVVSKRRLCTFTPVSKRGVEFRQSTRNAS